MSFIKIQILTVAMGIAAAVGWSWADFDTQRARAKITNASSNQPVPTQPLPSHPAQVSMKAADWDFHYAIADVPAHPSQLSPVHGWWFNMPGAGHHFLITTASPVLVQGWYVKMSSSISATNLFGSGVKHVCQIFFEEVGNYLPEPGYHRWWSTKKGTDLIVGLEPEFWSTVTGERGDAGVAATAGFQQALANPQQIGVVCDIEYGDDPFAGDVIGPKIPTAAFTMDSFAVCEPFAKQVNEACAPQSAQQR
jgi:hypothetical protein